MFNSDLERAHGRLLRAAEYHERLAPECVLKEDADFSLELAKKYREKADLVRAAWLEDGETRRSMLSAQGC